MLRNYITYACIKITFVLCVDFGDVVVRNALYEYAISSIDVSYERHTKSHLRIKPTPQNSSRSLSSSSKHNSQTKPSRPKPFPHGQHSRGGNPRMLVLSLKKSVGEVRRRGKWRRWMLGGCTKMTGGSVDGTVRLVTCEEMTCQTSRASL